MSREEREQHDALMDITDPFDNDNGDYEADFLKEYRCRPQPCQ
jgi:hypothetical protein